MYLGKRALTFCAICVGALAAGATSEQRASDGRPAHGSERHSLQARKREADPLAVLNSRDDLRLDTRLAGSGDSSRSATVKELRQDVSRLNNNYPRILDRLNALEGKQRVQTDIIKKLRGDVMPYVSSVRGKLSSLASSNKTYTTAEVVKELIPGVAFTKKKKKAVLNIFANLDELFATTEDNPAAPAAKGTRAPNEAAVFLGKIGRKSSQEGEADAEDSEGDEGGAGEEEDVEEEGEGGEEAEDAEDAGDEDGEAEATDTDADTEAGGSEDEGDGDDAAEEEEDGRAPARARKGGGSERHGRRERPMVKVAELGARGSEDLPKGRGGRGRLRGGRRGREGGRRMRGGGS